MTWYFIALRTRVLTSCEDGERNPGILTAALHEFCD
jgi:hypothetical protein